ncbi:MAG: head-tail connector protein [Oscillospiraceae bacterium]|nr:head-tail connector protein [Oscillospiraceae bacterium]
MLTDDRLASLLAYCKLTELRDDPEVQTLIPMFFHAAAGYLTQMGVNPPPEGSDRQAQYDLCVNYLVLDSWENREPVYVGAATEDNPAFRRMVNQLKWTEGE